jgi:hypothetical protein
MLPTFPTIIKLRREANVAAIKMAVRQMAPQFGLIGSNIQFEGTSHSITRADASVDETDMEPVSAEMQVVMGTPLKDFTPQVIEAHLVGVARQMAEGMSRHFFKVLDRVTSEHGMVVDAKGGPMTEDLILDAIEKMDHTFEEDGSWNAPTILTSQQIVEVLGGKTISPETNSRLAKILERKRDDFRCRQARRVLAG